MEGMLAELRGVDRWASIWAIGRVKQSASSDAVGALVLNVAFPLGRLEAEHSVPTPTRRLRLRLVQSSRHRIGEVMIWVKMATDAIPLAAWLWQNRQEFEPVLRKVGETVDFAGNMLANPEGAVRRAGNLIVFGQPGGGEKVIAFIEQTAPRIEAIEHAVDGLHVGQAAISSSLASLQTISMITLGITALTPVILSVQLVALNRRLGAIQKQIANLHKKFDAAVHAELEAGLEMLRKGQDFLDQRDRVNAYQSLNGALPFCYKTMNYYAKLLGNSLAEAKVNREEARLLARHLSVAVIGVASCHIGLEQDQNAFAKSGVQLDLLRKTAKLVFHELIGRDPAPYLLPPMREHGVTLDFMAKLFQQARDAGAVDPAQDTSSSGWFEQHRDALVHASTKEPLFASKKKWYGTLRAQLQEAVAAVEETNRVIGLARLVEEVRSSGQSSTLAVMEQCKQKAREERSDSCEYFAWGLD
jgi:hypothetical protein